MVRDWKAKPCEPRGHELACQCRYPGSHSVAVKNHADKVIITDGRNVEVGSFNYTRAAARVISENVLVVWDDPVVAQR